MLSFLIVGKASVAVFDGAAAVDDTEKDFFSAFPIKTDLVQMDGPSPSSSGKKLQDIMSSSSSDFTAVGSSTITFIADFPSNYMYGQEKLRLNWELEDDFEVESSEYQVG